MKDKIFKQLQELKINSKPGYRIYYENEMLVMNSGTIQIKYYDGN